MSYARYPDVITPEMLPIYAHIGDEELATDIAETANDIKEFAAKERAHRDIYEHSSRSDTERKIAAFRAEANSGLARDAEAFLAFLKKLQAARASASAASVPA